MDYQDRGTFDRMDDGRNSLAKVPELTDSGKALPPNGVIFTP